MQKRSRMPRDFNQHAAMVVKMATGQIEPEPEPEPPKEKNPNAVALGRLGGLKGGIARKTKLSKTKRTAIARKAVNARWRKYRESES